MLIAYFCNIRMKCETTGSGSWIESLWIDQRGDWMWQILFSPGPHSAKWDLSLLCNV